MCGRRYAPTHRRLSVKDRQLHAPRALLPVLDWIWGLSAPYFLIADFGAEKERKMHSPAARLPECSGPVNKAAAFGLSTDVRDAVYSECPTLYPGSFRDLQRRKGVYLEDMTGWKTINGTVVVGLISMNDGFESTLWALKCQCGKYFTMKGRGIRHRCRKGYETVCLECLRKTKA